MPAKHHAKFAAPWVDIDAAITTAGLISHRYTNYRKEWAQLLSGTDEQLTSFIAQFIWSPANFSVPEEAGTAFAKYLIPQIDKIVENNGANLEITRAFYAGYLAGLREKE